MPKGYPANGPNKGWRKKGEPSSFKGKHHTEESKARLRKNALEQFKDGMPISTRLKVSQNQPKKFGKDNSRWNENVGYSGVHLWLYKKMGKASGCAICEGKKSKNFQWANLSRSYKRDLSDWLQMCVSCHLRFDRNNWTLEQLKYYVNKN